VIDCVPDSVSGLHLTEDRINPKSATAIFEHLNRLLKYILVPRWLPPPWHEYIDDKDRVAV
jgi:hypothetical protein